MQVMMNASEIILNESHLEKNKSSMMEWDLNLLNMDIFEESFDSGICDESIILDWTKKLLEYESILFALHRDMAMQQERRDRLSKIVDRRPKRKCNDLCNVCSHTLDTDDTKNCVTCNTCNKFICRKENCCVRLSNDTTTNWECQLCQSERERQVIIENDILEDTELLNYTETNGRFSRPMLSRSELYIPIKEYCETSSLSNSESRRASTSALSLDQKIQIRDYVEDILGNMLGGSLDSVAVSQLSKNDRYIKLFHKYHTNLSQNLFMLENSIHQSMEDLPLTSSENELIGVSQTKLKQLIEKIVGESLRLPAIEQNNDETQLSPKQHEENDESLLYFEPQKYQELLATAVLNKIVDSKTNKDIFANGSTKSLSRNFDNNHNSLAQNHEENSSSGSSIEPRSDSSLTNPIHKVNKGEEFSPNGSLLNIYDESLTGRSTLDRESVLSDYLASHRIPLPELSSDSESPEEEYDSLPSNEADGSWEDNWLFKKTKLGHESSSIGMLVPAPKDDFRALIGDKTADEVSDFSEAGSDMDEMSMETNDSSIDPPNDRLRNKHLIGGKTVIGLFDELIEQTSMISSSSLQDNEPMYAETKNELVTGNDGLNEDSKFSLISLTSYAIPTKNEAVNSKLATEVLQNSPPKRYASNNTSIENFPEPILPPPIDFDDEFAKIYEEYEQEEFSTQNSAITNESPSEIPTGSIAEREHQKWKNAVEMPNNPYSPEALQRRISGSQGKFIDLPNISSSAENATGSLESTEAMEEQTRDYARYSRDYYINDSKHACGIKHKGTLETNLLKTPNDENQTQEHLPSDGVAELASVQRTNSSWTVNKQEAITSDIFTARPIIIDDLESIPYEETQDLNLLTSDEIVKLQNPSTLDTSQQLNTDSSLTLSEDSDTMRVYNLNKQETTIIRDNVKQLPIRPSTLSISNETKNSTSGTTKIAASPIYTPNKASTPNSFKFLQPKRKIIDPSQIITSDPDSPEHTPTFEKMVIEEEVANALPSVKALAQVFLLTSAKCSSIHSDNRPKSPITPPKPLLSPIIYPLTPTPSPNIEEKPLMCMEDEDDMRTVNLSSLPSHMTVPERPLSPNLVTGVLKNNIAFFENLKNTQ